MRRLVLALLFGTGLAVSLAAGEPPAPPAPKPAPDEEQPRTLSSSGQFSILGGAAPERGEVGKRGESLWSLFVKTTGVPPTWRHRILVQIHDRTKTLSPERRAVGRIFPLDQGYRIELNLLMDENFRWDEFRGELTKLFLMSQVIAANPDREIQERMPPWLLEGLHALLTYRQNGIPSEFFAALLRTRQMLSVDELLRAVPRKLEDSVSSGVFSACSAALVQALLDQPNGKVRFQAFLADLGVSSKSDQELLDQHFPSLKQEPENLDKWWALQIANMGRQNAYVVLSLGETERRLTELEMVSAPAAPAPAPPPGTAPEPAPAAQPPPKPKNPLLHFLRRPAPAPAPEAPGASPAEPSFEPVHLRLHDRYLKQPWAQAVLEEKRRQLTLLQAQCFPLYQPILGGYLQALAALQSGQVKGLGELLDRLDLDRLAVQEQMRGVEDYINWYSTTQIVESSHEFDGYTQALQLLEKLEQRKRPDPISRYLDAVERELNP